MSAIELPFLSSSPKFFDRYGKHRFGWAKLMFEVPEVKAADLRLAISQSYSGNTSGTMYEYRGSLWKNAINGIERRTINLDGSIGGVDLQQVSKDALKRLSNFMLPRLKSRAALTNQKVPTYGYAHAKAKTVLIDSDYEDEDIDAFSKFCSLNFIMCDGKLLARATEPSLSITWSYEGGKSAVLGNSVDLSLSTVAGRNNGVHFALDDETVNPKFDEFQRYFNQKWVRPSVWQEDMNNVWKAVKIARKDDSLIQNETFVFDPAIMSELGERSSMSRRSAVSVLEAISRYERSSELHKSVLAYLDRQILNPSEDFDDRLEELLSDPKIVAGYYRKPFVEEALQQLANRQIALSAATKTSIYDGRFI
jgi:hypothetical protein